jgi:hypothetical protein
MNITRVGNATFLPLGNDELGEDLIPKPYGIVLHKADREATLAVYETDYPPRVQGAF